MSSSRVAGLQWDFRNDDFFLYAHQSSSDVTRIVFESTDNHVNDEFVYVILGMNQNAMGYIESLNSMNSYFSLAHMKQTNLLNFLNLNNKKI